jgi:hypothetical protein
MVTCPEGARATSALWPYSGLLNTRKSSAAIAAMARRKIMILPHLVLFVSTLCLCGAIGAKKPDKAMNFLGFVA